MHRLQITDRSQIRRFAPGDRILPPASLKQVRLHQEVLPAMEVPGPARVRSNFDIFLRPRGPC